MPVSDQSSARVERTYFLVCANFAMLFILFCGLGLVLWLSIGLVSDLKRDLAKAEESVMELRDRLQAMDSEVVLQKAVSAAVESAMAEVAEAMPDGAALAELPAKLDATAEAIQVISQKVEELETEALANQVAYELLQGLGDGFSEAAEARRR